MILQQFDGQLLLVRQPDHGLQTGEFARHWGNDTIPPFTPAVAVIEAAARHDNGWSSWEERPTLDPATDRPWQFHKLPPHDHIPLYRRGIQDAAEHDPYTGLLVSLHGAGLYNDRYGTFRLVEQKFSPAERELVEEFLREQELFQQSLAERALGTRAHTHVTTDPNVWYNYLLLQVWDRLSLQYAFRLAADGELAPVPRPDGSRGTLRCVGRGKFSLALDPYPFDASPLVFPLNARLVPDKSYRNAEEFLEAMARAPSFEVECRAGRV